VSCDGFREALSARLDGEEPPDRAGELAAHLAACPDCRRWEDRAAAVTRRFRTGPAPVGVDVTEAVLPAAPGRGSARLLATLRVLLAGLGIAQLGLGLVQVAAAARSLAADSPVAHPAGGATPGHLWHESAAWNIAVGAAFLWVATRRGRPIGILPILSVFVAVLVLLSLSDLAAGRVEPARLASHGFMLAGYLVVLALARRQPELAPPGAAGWAGRAGRRAAGRRTPDPVIRLPASHQPAARTRPRDVA
jgi:predicted anti-sigma-YlaC factor YlaD